MLKRLVSVSILLASIPAFSQSGPAGPGGPGVERGPGGFAGAMRVPVTNAPYTATFTSTAIEKLQDGTVLNRSTTRTVYRDSLGRTREEVTLPAHGDASTSGSHTMVSIFDPVAHTVTQLRTEQKIAVVHALPQPPAMSGAAAGVPPEHPRAPREDKNVVKADLGAKTIAGLVAKGTRTTRTIPAGEMGNTAPLTSTHEEWFSPDLKIEVSRTDVDPFHGTRTVAVSALSKAEPDAALFSVPSGYTIQRAPEHAHHGPHRGSNPPVDSGVAPAPGA